jgi:hypothetical protein
MRKLILAAVAGTAFTAGCGEGSEATEAATEAAVESSDVAADASAEASAPLLTPRLKRAKPRRCNPRPQGQDTDRGAACRAPFSLAVLYATRRGPPNPAATSAAGGDAVPLPSRLRRGPGWERRRKSP